MSRRKAFTLVELLVVIGIIAVLIGILLPAMSTARRQSRSIKCLANLRSIGQAFSLYAASYNRTYPIARHKGQPDTIEQRWHDRLVPFVFSASRGDTTLTTTADFANLNKGSVIWGCPEYAEKDGLTAANYAVTGYGMSIYPALPEKSAADTANLAYKDGASNGKYYKIDVWGRKGSDRLLVAEGLTDHIQVRSAINGTSATAVIKRNSKWGPFTTDFPAVFTSTDEFWVDGARHAKPGTGRNITYTGKFMNALFCDGHAETISVRQAWQAIINPGMDTAEP